MFCRISIFFISLCDNYTVKVYFENRGQSPEGTRRGRATREALASQTQVWLLDSPFQEKDDPAAAEQAEAGLAGQAGSSPPVTFLWGPAPGLATALATAGLRPPVSAGKRSAAFSRCGCRARASVSSGAEDAGNRARTPRAVQV